MFVYILRSQKDNSFYTGTTRNVAERLSQHNKGFNKSTKSRIPWSLVRVEEYGNSGLALKRERFLKSGIGREVIKNLCSFDRKSI